MYNVIRYLVLVHMYIQYIIRVNMSYVEDDDEAAPPPPPASAPPTLESSFSPSHDGAALKTPEDEPFALYEDLDEVHAGRAAAPERKREVPPVPPPPRRGHRPESKTVGLDAATHIELHGRPMIATPDEKGGLYERLAYELQSRGVKNMGLEEDKSGNNNEFIRHFNEAADSFNIDDHSGAMEHYFNALS